MTKWLVTFKRQTSLTNRTALTGGVTVHANNEMEARSVFRDLYAQALVRIIDVTQEACSCK